MLSNHTLIPDDPELFSSLEQRCRYCRNKLVPLIDTEIALVWACTRVEEHGWPLVFWGGEHGEEGLRNAAWIIRALIQQCEHSTPPHSG